MSKFEVEIVDTNNGNRKYVNSSMQDRSTEEIKSWLESGFRKRPGIKFCVSCGNELNDTNETKIEKCNCGNSEFLSGYLASLVGGYIDMSKNRELKKYYQRIMRIKGGTKVRMNEKRTIMNLLIHKDKAIIQESIVYKIYNNTKVG